MTVSSEQPEIRVEHSEEKWNIKEDTDWIPFRNNLAQELGKWLQEFNQAEDEGIEIQDLAENAYLNLIGMLKEVARQTIGVKTNRPCLKRWKPFKWIKRRNKAARAWRKSNKHDKLDVMKAWKTYRKRAEKVKKEWVTRKRKSQDSNYKGLYKVRKKNPKEIWNKMRTRDEITEIQRLKEGSKYVTQPEEIKETIVKYMTKLCEKKSESSNFPQGTQTKNYQICQKCLSMRISN